MKPSSFVAIRVWGDFACFTRPEMKVERVSYPVMTPSAARGILEAIFWEPQMFYLIDSIRIIKRGQWISIRRNEVTKVISLHDAKTWMYEPNKVVPIYAGAGKTGAGKKKNDFTQRNMLALHDVEYLITAEVRLTPIDKHPENKLEKYLSEIERRARSGKCFHRPGLGMREFAADFEWEPNADIAEQRRAKELQQTSGIVNEDVGLMLYDIFDHRDRAKGFRWLREEEMPTQAKQRWTGEPVHPKAAFFHARINSSKLDCHPDRIQIITGDNQVASTSL